jgi:DNA polymerase-3 subunit epsilon
MTTVWIDTETGGLNPSKNPVLKIAGMIIVDGKLVKEFDFKVKPFQYQELDNKALKVNGITPEDIEREYSEPQDIFNQFKNILYSNLKKDKKYHIAGYNIQFDIDFLIQFFDNNAGKSDFFNLFFLPGVDIMQVANFVLMKERHLFRDFKQSTVANHLGIKINSEQLHDAIYDIKISREIAFKLYEILNGGKE